MNVLPILIPIAIVGTLLYVLARQLAKPSGWLGRTLLPRFLNNGNRPLLDAVLAAVAARAGERVADVGFGGGYTLRQLAPLVAPERPIGVELSETMFELAREEWGARAELHLGNVAALPFPDASLDAVLTVNTIYFWADPSAGLRELRRVLRPSGRLVLGARSKGFLLATPVAWFGFRAYSQSQLVALLRAAGFDASRCPAGRAEMVLLAHPRQEALSR